ncbi:MAG: radical SAM protein [bacterium]
MKNDFSSKNSKIFGQQKILNHPEKIKIWLDNKDETLITVEIDMTNNCNSKCPACIGARTNNQSITYDEAKNYIDQIIKFGAKGLIFTGGGEPTLNPDIYKTVKYAFDKGLDIGLITNGMIMTDETMNAIIKYCTWCRISLDAENPEVFKSIHGLDKNMYFKVLDNIKKLTDYRKKQKSEVTIGVGYLTGKETAKGIVPFAKLASTLGVDYAQFRPFHNNFTDITKEYLEAKKYDNDNFHSVASIQKYNRFKDEIKRPYDVCHGVNFCTVICADGTIQTCCHTRGKSKYILGNLKNNSFKEIWSKRKEVFSKIDFSDCGPVLCRADEFNRLLFEIAQKKQHINFL